MYKGPEGEVGHRFDGSQMYEDQHSTHLLNLLLTDAPGEPRGGPVHQLLRKRYGRHALDAGQQGADAEEAC